MSAIIGLLSVLGIIVGGVLSVKAVIQRKQKQKPLLLTGVSLLLLIVAIVLSPSSPTLEFDDSSLKTNSQGIATITGKTDKESELSVDGEQITTKDGSFSYKVSLTSDQPKKVTFTAAHGIQKKKKLSQSSLQTLLLHS
ncbi:hypothetical protein [Enterococcus wangshanyuanii]|uniref:Bacterial Ig domain-containing protein n=1 Tax=Enterococcus wangshanyuanii TaxID=2005703 RepID=A0ABQ1PH91_9ENTE|nr:hypothetical protein [Enterococcus wangshanyuanii]GGC97238.1 hypothetical protein GCM10011573_28470 [Enterococcus wangshanyuanii]